MHGTAITNFAKQVRKERKVSTGIDLLCKLFVLDVPQGTLGHTSVCIRAQGCEFRETYSKKTGHGSVKDEAEKEPCGGVSARFYN